MSVNQSLEALQRNYAQVMIPCEVCEGNDQQLLQRYGRIAEPGVYGPLSVNICRSCGFKLTNPRYEKRYYEDYYQELYRAVAFGNVRPSEEYVAQQKERGRRVLEYTQRFVSSPGRMLDHGCASGATMLSWQDAGWAVSGIDPHRPSVETGRDLFGLDIKVASGEDLPVGDGSVDLILSLGSLEHVADLDAAMRECRRVLSEGGWLIIRWRSNEIFGSPLEYYNHNHYRFFSRKTWRLLLMRYGFSVINMTSERIEGWDSYEYIVARRMHEGGLERVAAAIANGEGDDPDGELAHLTAVRQDYRDRCARFLDLYRQAQGDAEKTIRLVKADGLRWGFLGGAPRDVIERARMEAERYLAEFAAGRVE